MKVLKFEIKGTSVRPDLVPSMDDIKASIDILFPTADIKITLTETEEWSNIETASAYDPVFRFMPTSLEIERMINERD
jgi:hypothetical protein